MESGMAECFTPIAEKYGKECLLFTAGFGSVEARACWP